MASIGKLHPMLLLAAAALLSIGLKVANIFAGAPYITVDDHTMYEAGFLVWFGQAPPQRMYLESWISGVVALGAYVQELLASGKLHLLGPDIVADAYRAYYLDPDPFVRAYRAFALVADMLVAVVVYLFAREVSGHARLGAWFAPLVASLYLLSFNTLWCDLAARPDTLTALFTTMGLWLYYKSGAGERKNYFWGCAAAVGVATGLKLHGAFFVFFIVLDQMRIWRFREGSRKAFPFALVAFGAFLVSAGSPLFDPALYAKLRYLNARDDASPWIQWGEQFAVTLYGAGWLGAPLLLFGAWSAFRSGEWRNRTLGSVLFLAVLWLLLFCSIRQLRSYWMLPALPLIYAGAAYGLARIRAYPARIGVAAALVGIMAFQCVQQMRAIHSTQYSQLRDWITTNVDPADPFYMFGYANLGLPRSTSAIETWKTGIERKLASAVDSGDAFTIRHVREWEERSRLRLFDMLGYRSEAGYEYFGSTEAPPEEYHDVIDFSTMRYFIIQDHFPLREAPELQFLLEQQFEPVAKLTGPGGHSNGLQYQVFQRR